MGQHYRSSAIYEADESESRGEEAENSVVDKVLDYMPNTYPGRRLPHVWLSAAIPAGLTSTIDLAGHGAFVLFTGIGGNAWKVAAATVTESLGVFIKAYSIGFDQDYEDTYFDWARLRVVEESGCVLVRPDRFVVWRATKLRAGETDWATQRLEEVMRSVLSKFST